jgi:hypothetical protein
MTLIQALGKQAQTLPIIPQQLNQSAAPAAKGKQCAAARIFVQYLCANIAKPSMPLRLCAAAHKRKYAGQIVMRSWPRLRQESFDFSDL